MTLYEYENFVAGRCKPYVDFNYCVVALNEEAGEVAGWHKKATFRGNSNYTDAMLREELGDLLFYLTRTAALKGWSLTDVMKGNAEKLAQPRYAEKVSG